MIKTKFDDLVVKVNDRELKVGDKVLLENENKTFGHKKTYK